MDGERDLRESLLSPRHSDHAEVCRTPRWLFWRKLIFHSLFFFCFSLDTFWRHLIYLFICVYIGEKICDHWNLHLCLVLLLIFDECKMLVKWKYRRQNGRRTAHSRFFPSTWSVRLNNLVGLNEKSVTLTDDQCPARWRPLVDLRRLELRFHKLRYFFRFFYSAAPAIVGFSGEKHSNIDERNGKRFK